MDKPFFNKSIQIAKRGAKLFLFYFDLIKDSFIIATLVNLVGPRSMVMKPAIYTSQIIFVLSISVVFPVYYTTFQIALKYPLVLFGYQTIQSKASIAGWKIRIVEFLTIILAPIVPAVLIGIAEKENDDLKNICQKNPQDETIVSREEFLNLIKKLLLTVKEMELSVEVMGQVMVPLIMILLESSKTKTVSGLESVFKTDPLQLPLLPEIPAKNILILSVIVSLKTAIFTFLKMKSIKRDSFVPFTGKLILFFRATVGLSVRLSSYLLFLTPYLGLGGILAHHWTDTLPFNPKDSIGEAFYLKNSTLTYFHDGQLKTVPWTKLFKHYTGTSQHPGTFAPSYSDYTGMELQAAYLAFWALISGHLVLIMVLKYIIYRNVPMTTTSTTVTSTTTTTSTSSIKTSKSISTTTAIYKKVPDPDHIKLTGRIKHALVTHSLFGFMEIQKSPYKTAKDVYICRKL